MDIRLKEKYESNSERERKGNLKNLLKQLMDDTINKEEISLENELEKISESEEEED